MVLDGKTLSDLVNLQKFLGLEDRNLSLEEEL